MEKSKKVELTPELYKEISNTNTSRLIELKECKVEIMNGIEEELEVYNELLEERRRIDALITESRNNLAQGKTNKYKVSREISKQNKKAKQLNRIFAKGTFINLDKFGISQQKTKKR